MLKNTHRFLEALAVYRVELLLRALDALLYHLQVLCLLQILGRRFQLGFDQLIDTYVSPSGLYT